MPEREPFLMRLAKGIYAPVLSLAMRYRFVVMALAVGVFVAKKI